MSAFEHFHHSQSIKYAPLTILAANSEPMGLQRPRRQRCGACRLFFLSARRVPSVSAQRTPHPLLNLLLRYLQLLQDGDVVATHRL